MRLYIYIYVNRTTSTCLIQLFIISFISYYVIICRSIPRIICKWVTMFRLTVIYHVTSLFWYRPQIGWQGCRLGPDGGILGEMFNLAEALNCDCHLDFDEEAPEKSRKLVRFLVRFQRVVNCFWRFCCKRWGNVVVWNNSTQPKLKLTWLKQIKRLVNGISP